MLSFGQSVLVTGATGFIGGHLVRRLIARGCRVSCAVRASSRADALQSAGAHLLACDITDPTAVARAVASSSARVVFHLAGSVRALTLAEFMQVNAGGVDAVARACAEQTAPPVLLLVSSLAAAGHSGERPAIESDPPMPVSDYGRSKLAGEQAAANYAGNVPITVVRPCIVFGAEDRGVYQMFKPIARSGLHVVGGTGLQHVSLVAVADLVECVVLAAERGERIVPGVTGQGVYYAAAEAIAYAELGNAIARALGRPPPRVVRVPEWPMRAIGRFGDIVSRIRRRPGWVGSDKIAELFAGSWTCSSAKARQQLDWSPAASLDERLCETARWYRDARWLS